MATDVYAVEKYRVLSIIPGAGWQAVYQEESGERAYDVDFIGVADVWYDYYRRANPGHKIRSDETTISEVVGIHVGEDGLMIAQEAKNFVRLQPSGGKPNDSGLELSAG